MLTIATLGFSLVSAPLLFAFYVGINRTLNRSWFALTTCALLLLGLSCIQLEHLQHVIEGVDPLSGDYYVFLLLLTPSLFFLFSREVLLDEVTHSPWLLVNFAPLLLSLVLPTQIALSVVFFLGMVYCLWFVKFIYGMRVNRKRFRFEMFFYVFFFVIAVVVLALVSILPFIDHSVFYLFYGQSISLSFMLIVFALIAFPELLGELSEAAKLSYAASTLGGTPIDEKLQALDKLMSEEKIYQQEALNLGAVAELLELSTHQLSELINTQLNMSFSAYIRQQRVDAAKLMLCNEPSASILSIAMAVGFKSQSNFYVAFNDLVKVSPGQFRKQQVV